MEARCPLAAPHRGFASRAPPVKKSALLSQRRRAPNDSGSPLECLGSHDHPRPCHWDPIPGDEVCPLVKSGTGTESTPLEHQRRKVGAKGGCIPRENRGAIARRRQGGCRVCTNHTCPFTTSPLLPPSPAAATRVSLLLPDHCLGSTRPRCVQQGSEGGGPPHTASVS